MDSRYAEIRKSIKEVFSRYSVIEGSEEEFGSPSGSYKLQVLEYGPGNEPSWHYSRGMVTRQTDGYIIADVKRNYGHFWHAWIEHPNGNEYLLCGEDYQGYSVINLTRDSYQTYFPEGGYHGGGFCWTAVYPSPDKYVLAVDGCYWGSEYEIVFYDFRAPDRLPYQELGRTQCITGSDGWLDNDTFQIQREITLRKSDGTLYDNLSEAEKHEIDTDATEAEYRTIKAQVARPSFDQTV
jgi:hypothetical protein